jgi:hypothetical protein
MEGESRIKRFREGAASPAAERGSEEMAQCPILQPRHLAFKRISGRQESTNLDLEIVRISP